MTLSIWLMLLAVFLAGAVGGVVNAAISDNGFLLPKSEPTAGGATILRPGYLGNVLIGAVAAVISWGLYGPLGSYNLIGSNQALAGNSNLDKIGLSLASLVGAILIGIGGARWLSSEVDKNLLRAAASGAAGKPPSTDKAQQIAIASPLQALRIANTM